MTKLYDALIIGAGAAGLSCALALGRVHRSCVVFSNNIHRNRGAGHIHNVLTRDHTVPADFYAAARADVSKYKNTDFVETNITSVSKPDTPAQPHFVATDSSGHTWLGRTVVLATGIRDVFPELEGYAANWPHNIYQCPFCDGHERSELPIGVLAYPRFNPNLAKVCTIANHIGVPPGQTPNPGESKVTLFTNGPVDTKNEASRKAIETCKAHGVRIEEETVVKLEDAAPKPGMYVHLADGETVYVGFALHKPGTSLNARELIDGLGVDIVQGMFGEYVKTINFFKMTSIPGVYAAGDIDTELTSATGAMLEGVTAGAGVAHYCGDIEDREALERQQDVDQIVFGKSISRVGSKGG